MKMNRKIKITIRLNVTACNFETKQTAGSSRIQTRTTGVEFKHANDY